MRTKINTGKYKVLSIFGEVAPDVVGPMLVATQKFVKENPGTAQKLVTAAVQGMRLAYDDPKRFGGPQEAAPYNNEKLFWQGQISSNTSSGRSAFENAANELRVREERGGRSQEDQYDKGSHHERPRGVPEAALKKLGK